MKVNIMVLLFYGILFLVLSITALNLDYVEGDDAATILFHLMGRERLIQPPYSAYHSGMDFLLSFLPANEPILRTTSILISNISGFLGLCLLFLWISRFTNLNLKTKLLIGLFIPFMIPELIFQSLLYNPTNIGFVFCLLALLSLEYYLEYKKLIFLFFIPLFMFFGVPFRWSLLMFIATLASIYIYRREDLKLQIRNLDLTILGTLIISIIASIVGIWLTGHTPHNVLETFLWADRYMSDTEVSLSILFAMGLAFMTPTLLITTMTGLVVENSSLYHKLAVILIATLPFFILGFNTSLKYLIVLLPVILLYAAFGIDCLISRKAIRYSLIAILILPWVLGIQIHTSEFSYGPGFEINQWQAKKDASHPIEMISKNPDSRVANNLQPKLTTRAGFYLPTLEGPRPLFGYASCLLGGKWYEAIENDVEERKNLLRKMTARNISVVLQARNHARLQCLLFAKGYSSDMPIKDLNENFTYRDFRKDRKETIRVVVPKDKSDLKRMIDNLAQVEEKFGVYLTYSSEATFLENYSGIKRLGPYTLMKL